MLTYAVGEKGCVFAHFIPNLVDDSGEFCFVVVLCNVHDPANELRFLVKARIIAGI
jgi:hypothetical protein